LRAQHVIFSMVKSQGLAAPSFFTDESRLSPKREHYCGKTPSLNLKPKSHSIGYVREVGSHEPIYLCVVEKARYTALVHHAQLREIHT
jgi:hypothetical protein